MRLVCDTEHVAVFKTSSASYSLRSVRKLFESSITKHKSPNSYLHVMLNN